MPEFFQNVWSSVAMTALIRICGTSSSSAGSRSCTPSLPIGAPFAVHGRRLRQLAEAPDRGGVVICGRDLARAWNQRGDTHAEGEATAQDDGREPCKDASTWRHGSVSLRRIQGPGGSRVGIDPHPTLIAKGYGPAPREESRL